MKTQKCFMFTSSFIFLILIGSLCFAQTATQLFQQALLKENGEGNLKAAVEIYQKIVNDTAADRSLRAKAQLHIGKCWEKMGNAEAKKAYQRVVRDFDDLKDIASEARVRLTALEEKDKSNRLIVKKVWEGLDVDDTGEISPDGKYLSYVHWGTGDLALYEVATSEKRFLTNKGSWKESDEYALKSSWSPDSKRLVYVWVQINSMELRIISIDRSEQRTLLASTKKLPWIEVHHWSTDGKYILALCKREDNTYQIVTIAEKDGSLSVVKELGKKGVDCNLRFSPDGRYIVYDYPGKEELYNHDIYIISADGTYEVTLIEHPAHDCVLGWSSDGKHILFTSDRTGTPGIWALAASEGKPKSDPHLIKRSEGPNKLRGLGFTKSGSLYYCYFPNTTNVYTLELNPETGKLKFPPKEAIGHFIGSNGTPDYSPDGKQMAYVSRRAPMVFRNTDDPSGNVLVIRKLETGEEIEIKPNEIKAFGYPKWSPDSRSVIVVNWDIDGQQTGLYRINTLGKVDLIVNDVPGIIYAHEWSADEKVIFILRSNRKKNVYEIVLHDLKSGKETELYRGSWRDLWTISLSPDGKWLAFLGKAKQRTLRVIPAGGGEARIIHTFNIDNRDITHTWSADGKYIFMPKLSTPEQYLKWDLWRIPVDGGEPENFGLETNAIHQLSAHPNGRYIAFSSQGYDYELPVVWMMENFLLVNED